MRNTTLVCLALVVLAGGFAPPAEAQENGGRKGALIGTVVGTLAGAAAAGIFYKAGNCSKGNDYYDSVGVDCVLPMSAMVAGGGLAGYFIGRASEKRASRNDVPPRLQPAGTVDVVTLVPVVRLRAPAKAEEPRRGWGRLFASATVPE